MKYLILVVLVIGIASAVPLKDSRSEETKSKLLKQKLDKLHLMLRELSEKVDETKTGLDETEDQDELDSSLTEDTNSGVKSEEIERRLLDLESATEDRTESDDDTKTESAGDDKLNNFVRKLSPDDVAVLKKVRSRLQYLKKALEDESETESTEKREESSDITDKGGASPEDKIPGDKSVPEDVKELLKKFRSRQKYLTAALQEEKKNPGVNEADKGSVEKSEESNGKKTEGKFGTIKEDKRETDEDSDWDSIPVDEEDLGAKSVGTTFYDPDGKIKSRTLNEVEMRLLKDLKYAHDRGINIREMLEDLKAQRNKRSSSADNLDED